MEQMKFTFQRALSHFPCCFPPFRDLSEVGASGGSKDVLDAGGRFGRATGVGVQTPRRLLLRRRTLLQGSRLGNHFGRQKEEHDRDEERGTRSTHVSPNRFKERAEFFT